MPFILKLDNNPLMFYEYLKKKYRYWVLYFKKKRIFF